MSKETLSEENQISDFAAGYNKARGIEQPPAEDVDEEIEGIEQEDGEQEPEEPMFLGMKESELKAKLARIDEIDSLKGETRKAFGKVGELNSVIQQMREAQKQTQVAPAKLAHLEEEYPELAELLAKDLSGALHSDKSDVVESRLAEVTRQFEEKLLTTMHPDWQSFQNSREFSQWVASLPAHEVEELRESDDALFVGKRLSDAKQWLQEQNQKTTQSDDSVERKKQEKRSRLEAAALPNGTSAPISGSLSDTDRFRAGYNKIAKSRHS